MSVPATNHRCLPQSSATVLPEPVTPIHLEINMCKLGMLGIRVPVVIHPLLETAGQPMQKMDATCKSPLEQTRDVAEDRLLYQYTFFFDLEIKAFTIDMFQTLTKPPFSPLHLTK